MGPRVGLYDMHCRESNLDRPARSPSLSRLQKCNVNVMLVFIDFNLVYFKLRGATFKQDTNIFTYLTVQQF
jgi:hypothetical protein